MGTINSGTANAQNDHRKNTLSARQVANRVGQKPQRFFQPHVVQAKDRYYEERRDKHWQRGRKKVEKKVLTRNWQESALWLEHKAILEKVGVDVEAPYWKWR